MVDNCMVDNCMVDNCSVSYRPLGNLTPHTFVSQKKTESDAMLYAVLVFRNAPQTGNYTCLYTIFSSCQ